MQVITSGREFTALVRWGGTDHEIRCGWLSGYSEGRAKLHET
jgi:hypothetical protein